MFLSCCYREAGPCSIRNYCKIVEFLSEAWWTHHIHSAENRKALAFKSTCTGMFCFFSPWGWGWGIKWWSVLINAYPHKSRMKIKVDIISQQDESTFHLWPGALKWCKSRKIMRQSYMTENFMRLGAIKQHRVLTLTVPVTTIDALRHFETG